MNYPIEYTPTPNSHDVEFLVSGTSQEAFAKKGFDPIEPFAFFIRDENQAVLGGLHGYIYYGCLYIDQLYLAPSIREQGYGSHLIQKAEELARSKNCNFITVTTMDWEARKFYEKLGYTVFYLITGYHKGSSMYCLRKDLL